MGVRPQQRHQRAQLATRGCRAALLAAEHLADLFNMCSARGWDSNRAVRVARRDLALLADHPAVAALVEVLNDDHPLWADPGRILTRLQRRRAMIRALARTR